MNVKKNKLYNQISARLRELLIVTICFTLATLSSVSTLSAASLNATNSAIGSVTVVVGSDGAQFFSDRESGEVTQIEAGTILYADGRSEDDQQLYVETDAGQGWIAKADVIAFGIQNLTIRTPNVQLVNTADVTTAEETTSENEVIVAENALDSELVNDVSASDAAESDVQELDEADTLNETESDVIESTVAERDPVESPAEAEAISTEPDTSAVEAVESADSEPNTATEYEVGFVTSPGLNVRSGPGVQNDVLAQAVQGDQLTIVERGQDGGWLQVAFAADDPTTEIVGWVSASYVASTMPQQTESAAADLETQPVLSTGGSTGSGSTGLSGTLVFQQSIGGQIYAYSLDNGSLWSLTTGAEPALSPDGSTVAFTRSDGLYLIDIDGSNERLIFSGRENLGSPKWSPEGDTIIFTRGDEWQTCAKRGNGERCTESNVVSEGQYKKIMYAIASVDTDGENYRDIVSTKPARAPDWTSAGIVYQSYDGLQLTSADSDAVNTLIDYDYLDPFYYDPDWQPGGSQIVFESNEGSHWQIFTINSDGSGRTALTRPKTALVDRLPSSVAPAFSPDGQHIVYVSNMTDSGEAGDWRLWVMNADGSNQRMLPIDLKLEYTFGVEQVVSWR